jgi:hypothetical protein
VILINGGRLIDIPVSLFMEVSIVILKPGIADPVQEIQMILW